MKNISTLKKRVLEHIKKEGVSKNKFYKKTGIPNGTLDKESGVSEMFIEKYFSAYPNINPTWLITGQGDMLRGNDTLSNQKCEQKQSTNLIPLYEGVTIGGQASVANMDAESNYVEKIDAGDWFRDATAAMRVHGNSMQPEYQSGSIVALKEVIDKRLIIFGQDYVVETSEYRVIKRLQKSDDCECWLCCSINEEVYNHNRKLIHEPFDVPVDAVSRLYKVLGNVTRNESCLINTI